MGKKSFTPSVGKKYRNTTLKIKLKLKNNNNNNIKKTLRKLIVGALVEPIYQKNSGSTTVNIKEKRKRNLQQNKERHRKNERRKQNNRIAVRFVSIWLWKQWVKVLKEENTEKNERGKDNQWLGGAGVDIAKQKERMRIYVYRNDEANDLARVVLPIMAIVL